MRLVQLAPGTGTWVRAETVTDITLERRGGGTDHTKVVVSLQQGEPIRFAFEAYAEAVETADRMAAAINAAACAPN